MITAYYSHPDCALHAMGAGHPECPERLAAVADALESAGLMPALSPREAPLVSREALARAHGAAYLDRIEAAAPQDDSLVRLDPDTAMNRHSLQAARRAAGALVAAVDEVLGGAAQRAFCNLRPPGHHAERDRAMGFCLYNNVAVAALHALEAHGLSRVSIVDFDVHYGNGTADIFRGDARVQLLSSYQFPLYPLERDAPGDARQINVALPAGSDGAAFRAAVSREWFAALEAFAPELLLISAGFDAHAEDPLAGLRWVEDDYAWITRELLQRTAASSRQRCISTLEGGYALGALGRSAAAHVAELVRYD